MGMGATRGTDTFLLKESMVRSESIDVMFKYSVCT
jgi:hypothetical protein